MTTGRRARAGRAPWTAAATLLSLFVFAPVLSGGACSDAVRPEASYCESWQRSLVGMDTNVWIWLGATVVSVALVWALVPRRAR